MMRKLPELRGLSIGPIASEILRNASELDVLAVFERSFYLMAPTGIICVALDGIGPGPINVLISPTSGRQPWTGGLPADTKAVTSAGRLTVGTAFTIDLATAVPWLAPAWPDVSKEAVARGVAGVLKHSTSMIPSDGLAALVLAPTHRAARSASAEAATGLIADVRRDLASDLSRGVWNDDARRAVTLLVGLGPGLTPSGDDMLGGMMLALTALGMNDMRDALWHVVGGELNDLTVPISAMHLSAAADGLGAEAIHDMIGAIILGEEARIAHLLPAMDTIGATSGWDALAGAIMVLSAAAP